MNIIKELQTELQDKEELYQLTDTQKAVLIIVFMSVTPEQAYESTIGTRSVVNSRVILIKLGLLTSSGPHKLFLTELGEKELVNYNLIDEQGELTELGSTILANYQKNFSDLVKTESIVREII